MTLINPKTYDAIYKGKRDRDKIEFIYIPEAPFAGSLISKSPLSYLDVDVISLNELAKVELKGRDKSGKYRVDNVFNKWYKTICVHYSLLSILGATTIVH